MSWSESEIRSRTLDDDMPVPATVVLDPLIIRHLRQAGYDVADLSRAVEEYLLDSMELH